MMRFLAAIVSVVFLLNGYLAAQENDLSDHNRALGFEFGISNRDALKLLEKSDRSVIENTLDSNRKRTILFEGSLVDFPPGSSGLHRKTRLEFWNEKLMSTALFFDEGTEQEHEGLSRELSEYLSTQFGGPSSRDSFMNFRTWTWQLPKLKVVLSSNTRKRSTKIEYTYKPLYETMEIQEYEMLVRTPEPDPAQKMLRLKEEDPTL